MNDPTQPLPLPQLVITAKTAAADSGFTASCSDAVGNLLRTLATTGGPILELGTGVGVGTAWLASGTTEPIYSYEIDASTANMARELLAPAPNVEIVTGTFSDVEGGNFAVAFVDVSEQKDNGQPVIDKMRPGGIVVLDDFTPEWKKIGDMKDRPDTRKRFWLNHPQLNSTEVLTTTDTSAIIAVKSHCAQLA